MDFLTAIQTCFRKSFVFKGRASRSEFWYWVLFILIASAGLTALDKIIFDTPLLGIKNPIEFLFSWITLPASLSVGWRRLHDIGRSGWWIGSGFLWLIFTLCLVLGLTFLVSGPIESENAALLMMLKPFAPAIEALSFASKWFYLPWGIILFVFFCMPSTGSDNRFGAAPKHGQSKASNASTRSSLTEFAPQSARALAGDTDLDKIKDVVVTKTKTVHQIIGVFSVIAVMASVVVLNLTVEQFNNDTVTSSYDGRYEGEYIGGIRSGKGVFTWPNGNRYEGDFVAGARTGKGIYTWANGDRYEGDFVAGARTGKGIYTWVSGNRYDGDYVSGKRTGKGTFTWIDGSRYEGDFIDGKRTGNGVMIWANGQRSEGQFLNGVHQAYTALRGSPSQPSMAQSSKLR